MPPVDKYDISNPLSGADGLLGAVLGKQANTNTDSNQNTTDNTTQAVTGNQTVTGSQGTTGTQATTGSQATTGTQSTTGTQTARNNQATDQKVVNDADTSALRQVFAKQSQGINADMLSAIFQQGVKAAPNLVTAQAGALGARGVGNSPMAQVLNQLNGDLTSKAADINRQLLADSGVTAGNIANATRTTNTTGSTVNDTVTDSNQIATTDQNVLNNQNVVNNQQVTNNQATATDQNVVGTKAQNIVANEQKKQATTINTSVAKKLAGLAAAGVGIDELFKIATGQGFVGNLATFANYMKGVLGGVSTGGVANGAGGLSDLFPGVNLGDLLGSGDTGSGAIDWSGSLGSAGVSSSGSLLDNLTGTDWSGFGFADGGMPSAEFLPIDPLIKKQTIIGNQDGDLNALLNAMGGSSSASSGGSSSGGSSTGGGSSGTATGSSNSESTGGGDGGGSIGSSSSSSAPNDSSDQGTANGTIGSPVSNNTASNIGSVVGFAVGISPAIGSLIGQVTNAAIGMTPAPAPIGNTMAAALAQMDAQAIENASQGNGSSAGDSADGTAGVGVGEGGIGSSGAGTAAGDAAGNSEGSGGAADGSGSAGDSGGGSDGGSSGGDGGGGDGGAYADGGQVDPILEALGVGIQSQGKMMKMLHGAMVAKSAPGKMANGGQIKGPGTGTSDSIKAVTPSGQIKVSHGEYIIPADVVQKFGAQAFDKLVQQYHVPAEMQEAITGAK